MNSFWLMVISRTVFIFAILVAVLAAIHGSTALIRWGMVLGVLWVVIDSYADHQILREQRRRTFREVARGTSEQPKNQRRG